MNRLICPGLLSVCVIAARLSIAADDNPLDHPFLPKPDAVVTIDAKTTAKALEILPPFFARTIKGTKVEVHTTHGWGWVERSHLLNPKDAEAYFKMHNNDPYSLYLRSFHHLFNEHKGNQKDKVLADLNAAIKLDPKYAPAFYGRANVHAHMGENEKALADFLEAIKLDPKNLVAANDIAWFRATCPVEKYRDGKQAVAEATRVCEATGYKHEVFLSTLAAACAEAGDFKSAVKWATKATQIDSDDEEFAEHLKLYKSGKPYRDVPQQQ